jgi:hypothetical protein
MPGLFISYRRDDQAGFAGRLADVLESVFGADNVFRDIEDIRPGDDFVIALRKQLQGIDLMLVMIGPAWLTLSRNGVRRLDEAEDYVRQEIEVGLTSGKPVLPVLVGGATMPEEKNLPASIRALARRQAFVLSDTGWSSDVARLVQLIRPLLPVRRRFRWRPVLLVTLAAMALLAVGLKLYWQQPATPPTSNAVSAELADLASKLTGRWTAEVKYDWGDKHNENFTLQVENGEVHGTASFLSVANIVEQGQLRGDRLSFVTHSQETLGDSRREVTHRYRAMLKSEELHFVLETTGAHSSHTPVEFVARRTSK